MGKLTSTATLQAAETARDRKIEAEKKKLTSKVAPALTLYIYVLDSSCPGITRTRGGVHSSSYAVTRD